MRCDTFAPGVLLEQLFWTDRYIGAAEDLVAADVVARHQLPGSPGNGITRVAFKADGTRARRGAPNDCTAAGYFKVYPASRGRLCVERRVSEEVARERNVAHYAQRDREEAEQRAQARSWPFPVVHGKPPL